MLREGSGLGGGREVRRAAVSHPQFGFAGEILMLVFFFSLPLSPPLPRHSPSA